MIKYFGQKFDFLERPIGKMESSTIRAFTLSTEVAGAIRFVLILEASNDVKRIQFA